MIWTEEKKARLKDMAADGMTASQMANEIGCTRSAAIGKIHRDRIPWADSRQRQRASHFHEGPRRAARTPRWVARRLVAIESSPPPPPPVEIIEPGPPGGLPLVELGPTQCHWALTKTLPHFFCAAVITNDKDYGYCAEHRARCYEGFRRPAPRLPFGMGRVAA